MGSSALTRTEPGAPALEVWSLSHWTTREVPPHGILNERGHQVLLLTLPTLREQGSPGWGFCEAGTHTRTHTHTHTLALSLETTLWSMEECPEDVVCLPPTPPQYIFPCAEILMNELQVANLDSQLLESPQGTTVPLQRAMTCQLFAFLEKPQLENPFNYHGR